MTQTAASQSLFAPANMSAGGFLSNVDAVIVSAKFGVHADTPFDPLGKDEEDSCYLIVGFVPDEAEDDTPKLEYYRLGVVSKVTPSTDGAKAVFQEGARLNKSTKAGLFFASLVNAGFPVKDLPADNSAGFLVNLHVHLEQVAQEIKDGGSNKRFGKKDDKDAKSTFQTTLITKLLEPLKGKKGGAKTTGTAAPAGQSAAAPAAAGDTDKAIQGAIVDLIMVKGGAEKRLLPGEIMKSSLDQPTKNAAFKVLGNDGWLSAGPWAYDQGAGSLSMNELTAQFIADRG